MIASTAIRRLLPIPRIFQWVRPAMCLGPRFHLLFPVASLVFLPLPESFAAQSVPIHIVDGVPLIPVQLGTATTELVLDTGGQITVSLPRELVGTKADVQLTGAVHKSTDAAGHILEFQQIVANDVRIGNLKLGTLHGQLHREWGLAAGSDAKPAALRSGAIGMGAFFPRNLLLDLPEGRLTIFEPGEGMQVELRKDWLATSFSYDRRGPIVVLQINGVASDWALDSPATMSMVRMNAAIFRAGTRLPCKKAQKRYCGMVEIEAQVSRDAPPIPLRIAVVEMAPTGFDGLLGMDFFRQHAIYFDFDSGRLYLSPEQGVRK